jgi:TatD DNase family protein
MNQFKFDMHMHFDLYKDRKAVLNYIEDQKSYTIAVTNLPVLYEKYYKEYTEYKYIRFALGFHPELANDYKEQISVFLKNIMKTRYIGEIGLDFSTKDNVNRQAQYKVFSTILDACNTKGDKILSVHSRKASKEVNELLQGINAKVILHWFTGNDIELGKAISRGYYFSINQQMINNNTSKKLIKKIPIEKILIESDAPFTKGLRETYDVSFIDEIYSVLANLYDKSADCVEEQLKCNLQTLVISK